MGFWRRLAGISRKDRIPSSRIREITESEKYRVYFNFRNYVRKTFGMVMTFKTNGRRQNSTKILTWYVEGKEETNLDNVGCMDREDVRG